MTSSSLNLVGVFCTLARVLGFPRGLEDDHVDSVHGMVVPGSRCSGREESF